MCFECHSIYINAAFLKALGYCSEAKNQMDNEESEKKLEKLHEFIPLLKNYLRK